MADILWSAAVCGVPATLAFRLRHARAMSMTCRYGHMELDLCLIRAPIATPTPAHVT